MLSPHELRRRPTDPLSPDVAETSVIEPDALEALIAGLGARGYRVLGPTVRDGAIVYDDLASAMLDHIAVFENRADKFPEFRRAF